MSAWVPTAMSILAVRQFGERGAARGRPVAPGDELDAQTDPLGKRGHPLIVLAGEDFGRRHHRRLPSRFDHVGHRHQRDHRLAGSDVALEKPQHALLGFEIGADILDRLLLRFCQRERQRGLEAAPQCALGVVRAAGNGAHARPHEQERELVGEQFVIGEAGRRRTGRVDVLGPFRPVHRAERLGEAGQFEPAQGVGAEPFRQPGHAFQRSLGGAGDGARVEALGQPVDRLDRRQAGEFVGVHHPVGMDDLSPAVPKLELARDPAPGADRQLRAHPFGIGEEEHKLDVAGVVLDQHFERRPRARASCLAVLGNRSLDGHDRVGDGVADLRPRAPVDGRLRQVEEHVDDPRPFGFIEQAIEQFRILRPDPRQRGGGREQGIKQGRTHGGAYSKTGGQRRSYDAEEEGERPTDAQQQRVVGFADHTTDLGDGNGGDFVDGDLRDFTQAIALRGMNFKPELVGVVAQHRGQRANDDRRQFGEKIALHDKRGTRFAIISSRRDDHELAAPH